MNACLCCQHESPQMTPARRGVSSQGPQPREVDEKRRLSHWTRSTFEVVGDEGEMAFCRAGGQGSAPANGGMDDGLPTPCQEAPAVLFAAGPMEWLG